ncbi:hypothetical protein ABT143_17350 [Streptomyces sp. NPDC002033]|uniref:hypothetical protein n=1 Tax=unclassified Streptomyces TaxID=2593676 RepID=UPI0033225BB4
MNLYDHDHFDQPITLPLKAVMAPVSLQDLGLYVQIRYLLTVRSGELEGVLGEFERGRSLQEVGGKAALRASLERLVAAGLLELHPD